MAGFGGPRTLPVRRQPAPSVWARTGAAAVHAQPAAPRPAASPWSPAPLPSGLYNPSRGIESEESERGLGQLEGRVGTARARDSADYYVQKAELERQGQQGTTDYQRAQGLLKQTFSRLGTRQTEGANTAGVLQGGALLQSAAKRAANEAQQSQSQTTAYQRQQQGTQDSLARLAREGAPPDTANPLGGRNFQDLLTELTNAQSNNTFFTKSQSTLAGQEAAERGYVPPSAPRAAVAPAHHAPSAQAGAASGRAAFARARGRRW